MAGQGKNLERGGGYLCYFDTNFTFPIPEDFGFALGSPSRLHSWFLIIPRERERERFIMERANYGRGRGRDGGGGRRGGGGRFGGGGGGGGRDQEQQHQYHQHNQGGGRGGRDQQQHQHYRQQGQYHQYNQGGRGRGGGGRGLSYAAASAVQRPAQQWGRPRSYGSAGESSARGAWGPGPRAWRPATPPPPPQPDRAPKPPPDETCSGTDSRTLKILSYNVWFREDLEMHKRMKALGDLIQLHSPDLICFQEVTPNIYDMFQQSNWWKAYRCSISNEMAFTRPYFCMQLSRFLVKSYSCKPFSNSIMGRELCVAEVEVQADMRLVVATSHLESPCPAPPKWDQMFSKERVHQAKEAVNFLNKNPNVIFCGDMNWDDELDGQFPLPEGWIDAWTQLRPGENGFTYDTKSNQMLSGNRTLQRRLDRFICNLRDFEIRSIDMIGMEAIPGLTYSKEKKVRNAVRNLVLPVLPSDHYGLLLTICTQ